MSTNYRNMAGALLLSAALMACTQKEGSVAPPQAAASMEANAAQEEFIPEALPPHLASRVAASREALAGGPNVRVSFGMISGLKIWPPENSVLKVCFFRGGPQLRDRIVRVAKLWVERPVGIALDFGTAPRYRDCLPAGNEQIRVGFQYNGYWSLVGQDSYASSSQEEQSMNFQGFLVRPPADPEFSRVVLHEFGHALGFEHEHQHPWSRCAEEFDMPAIAAYLSGPPNYWDEETIRHNMEEESADDKILTNFDAQSIMLYSFPRSFYKHPDASVGCFTPGNFTLSTGDLSLLAKVYPADNQVRLAALSENVNSYVSALRATPGKNEEKVVALSELVKFTRGRLPKDALKGVPTHEVPKELRESRPMQ